MHRGWSPGFSRPNQVRTGTLVRSLEGSLEAALSSPRLSLYASAFLNPVSRTRCAAGPDKLLVATR